MSTEKFGADLQTLYQGEVIGEVAFDALLAQFEDPDLRYKIVTVLQLETETKARLRPAMMQLGLAVAEDDASRAAGRSLAAAVQGMVWKDAMAVLRDAVKPYLEQYKTIAEDAPENYKSLAQSMVEHEFAVYDFLAMESEGKTENTLESVIKLLTFPISKPLSGPPT